MRDIDSYRGCFVGGAVGDTLGYFVEFMDEQAIFEKFGKQGITEYVLDSQGIARFSDDTQMTLYTANSLLVGTTRGATRGVGGTSPSYAAQFYEEWYRTQTEPYPLSSSIAWISAYPELFERRAPGNTCLDACIRGAKGTITDPINTSKGCGGIMRVAPVGLYLDPEDKQICETRRYSYEEVQRFGADIAALTHGHELGWLPAAVLAHIVSKLSHDSSTTIREAALDALDVLPNAFPRAQHVPILDALLRKAIELSESEVSDLDVIHELGEGWVAEETLAVALFCALRYSDNFESAVVAAVNHSGDSDSTGSVTGNIVGAKVGLEGIPEKFVAPLELSDVIVELADDLFYDCPLSEYERSADGAWEHKYIASDYADWKKSVS